MDDKQINELTLLLLYLTAWEEGERTCSWRGYSFKAMEHHAEELNIIQFKNSKMVAITKAGRLMAEKLKEKYFGEGK